MKNDKFLDQKAKDMSIEELVSAIKIKLTNPLQIHIQIKGKERKGMSMMGMAIEKFIRQKYPYQDNGICSDCGGLIRIRNPTGKCDHLYYPEMKTIKNKGFAKCEKTNEILTSNPPQYRCKNCRKTWFCSDEVPNCDNQNKKEVNKK